MRMKQLKKTVLLLVMAAMMLLSACKIVVMDEVPKETKRTRLTTEETTKRTTKAKTTTEPRTTPATDSEDSAGTMHPTAVPEAPATEPPYVEDTDAPATEPPEVPAATAMPGVRPEMTAGPLPGFEVEDPNLRLDFEKMSLPALEDRFFLSAMAEESMDAFQQVYYAVANFEPEVRFREPITQERMNNIMLLINYTCPELMQIDCEYYYYTNADGMCTSVEFIYLLDESTYEWACGEISGIFDELRAQTRGMSDLEKEKFVYELIIDVCTYDRTTTHSGTCYGSMLEGVARCEGYSKAFMWMMWALDIPCMTITGDILEDGDRHSWNVVEINGVFGHVDTTHDDVEEDGEQYPYPYGFFNVSDAIVGNTRTIDRLYHVLDLPACDDESMNFHVLNGSFADSGDSAADYFVELLVWSIETGEKTVYLQCADRNAYYDLTNAIDLILNDVLSSMLNSWSYSWYVYPSSQSIVVELSY